MKAAEQPAFDGIGFVLDAARDGIVGVDLDGCRDPETGRIEAWATRIINGADELHRGVAERHRREDPGEGRPGARVRGQ